MVKRGDQIKLDAILEKIYYNIPGGGPYLGPDKLYRVLKIHGINNIGKNTIKKWLQNQDDYSLQKPTRKTFKKARVVVSDDQFDADLANLSSISHENSNFKHLLVVVNIFSKYL